MVRQKPPAVLKAIFNRDIARLSAFGKRGAEKRKNNRREEARRRSRMLAELEERAHQANEDICPVDD
jgi:hypothetical protein